MLAGRRLTTGNLDLSDLPSYCNGSHRQAESKQDITQTASDSANKKEDDDVVVGDATP